LPSRLRLRNTQTANRTTDETTVELRRPQQEAILVVAACGAQPSNPQQQTAFGSAPLSAILLTDDLVPPAASDLEATWLHLDTNLLFRQPVGRVLIIRRKPRLLALTAP